MFWFYFFILSINYFFEISVQRADNMPFDLTHLHLRKCFLRKIPAEL